MLEHTSILRCSQKLYELQNNSPYPCFDFDRCLVISHYSFDPNLNFEKQILPKIMHIRIQYYFIKAFAPTWIVLCPVFFACHKIQKFTIGKNIFLKEHSKYKHDFLDNSSFQPFITSEINYKISYEWHVKLLRISLKFAQFYVKKGWKSLSSARFYVICSKTSAPCLILHQIIFGWFFFYVASYYNFFFCSEAWGIKWGNFLKSGFPGKDLDFQKKRIYTFSIILYLRHCTNPHFDNI